jgi:hypothetical protein
MSSPINGLSSSYLQSILNSTLQAAGVTTGSTATNSSTALQQPDNGQLSPFARVASELQQLQTSDPAKYKQVTAQIGANLAKAAETAQSSGNTTAASQLKQLSADFTNASQTGQLPNLQDLAKATGGHHHHHAHAASADSDANSSASPATGQLLSALQTNGNQSTGNQSDNALNPLAIISSTLSNAGINITSK